MKVAIYSRKSLETDKGDSTKNQIRIVKDYFSGRSCEFFEFQDEGFSGGNTNRPDFQRMLNLIKNKQIDIIAVYKIDRIARNIIDFVNFYDQLKKHDITLVSVTEGFDFSTHMGKLVMMILATFADMERENIRQRVKDNMRELAKTGKWTGGTVPFGYISERVEEGNKKATYLRADEANSAIISEIFSYYIETNSMHQVQKWLYKEKNIKWCMSTIKNILTSPVYVMANNEVVTYLKNFGEVYNSPNGINGIITYNRRPYSDGKHRWNDKDMFYSISKHKGLIEPSVWLKVQAIQNKTKNTPRPKSSQVSYLTGVLKCGKCGSNMTVSYNHKNKDGSITYVYICTGRKDYGSEYCDCRQIKQKVLDGYLIDYLNNYVKLKKDHILKLMDNKDTCSNTDKIRNLEKKINTNNKKIDNLVDKLSDMTNEEGAPFMSKIKNLTKENEELKVELLHLHQEMNTSLITPDEIYENFTMAVSLINDPSIDIDTKKLAIEKCISKIEYIRHDIDNMDLKVTFL